MSESPFEARLKAAYCDVYEEKKPDTEDVALKRPEKVEPKRTDPKKAEPKQTEQTEPKKIDPDQEKADFLRERINTVHVYVLGINIEYNEPDVFVTQVTCTEQEYYEEGVHLAMAEERAKQNGFIDPLFSFDERETGVIGKLGKLFGKP